MYAESYPSTPPGRPQRPAPLGLVREGLLLRRGRAKELRRFAECLEVPVLCLDNDGRLRDANAASRLFLRRTRDQLRRMTVGDLLPPRQLAEYQRVWSGLLRDGDASGTMDLRTPDGAVIRVDYFALANALPAHHLLLWVPSQWPVNELTALTDAKTTASTGRLSEREREVLTLLTSGATTDDIAAELSVAPTTVKTHLRNALRRLGARNRAHAVALAVRTGEIALEGSGGPG